jgi:hypothetical protein
MRIVRKRRESALRLALVLFGLTAALAPRPAAAVPPGFAFLDVPAGARASALGGAFVSAGSGVEAAFWNPAGLALVERVEIAGSHYEFIEGLRHEQFALAGRQLGGAVALSLRAFYSQPVEARDDLGNLTGTFGGHDLDFAVAYGRTLAPGVHAGLAAHLIRERIADQSTGTWSMSAGMSWAPATGPLRLGIAVDHLGPDAHYTFAGGPGQPLRLPAAVQAGATWSFAMPATLGLATTVETRLTRGREPVAMAGAELSHVSGAALRLGGRANDSASTFSMGAGYALRALRLDYAFVPFRLDLGDTHRISFTARF